MVESKPTILNRAVSTVIPVAVTLLTAAVPIYVTYDLYGRGPTPEKHLRLESFGAINPLRDLSDLGENVELQIRLEDQSVDNIVIAKAFLTNVGSSPILPKDFHENLSISVLDPWKIVAVAHSDLFARSIKLRWTRVTDTKFEAEPALLNPGDRVDTVIYLTNTEFDRASPSPNIPDPTIKWHARIANMRAFEIPPSLLDRFASHAGFLAHVELTGWSLIYTIVSALLFQALYIHLLFRARVICDWGWFSIGIIVCASFLSFAAAESSATYLFGSLSTEMFGIPHWLNAPPILLHVLALFVLYMRVRSHRTVSAS